MPRAPSHACLHPLKGSSILFEALTSLSELRSSAFFTVAFDDMSRDMKHDNAVNHHEPAK